MVIFNRDKILTWITCKGDKQNTKLDKQIENIGDVLLVEQNKMNEHPSLDIVTNNETPAEDKIESKYNEIKNEKHQQKTPKGVKVVKTIGNIDDDSLAQQKTGGDIQNTGGEHVNDDDNEVTNTGTDGEDKRNLDGDINNDKIQEETVQTANN